MRAKRPGAKRLRGRTGFGAKRPGTGQVRLLRPGCKQYSCTGTCVVKNMLDMYLKYHKAGLTPTTPVTSTSISLVKMLIGRKSLTNLRSEMIFL